jgi:mono/diheme cytochrome c family protein
MDPTHYSPRTTHPPMWATNLKVGLVVIGTLAFYTLIANSIPQIQSEVPRELSLGSGATPEQLVAAGRQLYEGAGGCTACHGLGTRAPNLLTDEKGAGPIGARCGSREPGKTCKQYLHESLSRPAAFVVSGYGPIMPDVSRTLSPQQVWALIAFLESQGGTVDVTASDIPAAPDSRLPAPGAGGGLLAGGNTDPQAIIQGGGCIACHVFAGMPGGAIGPDLTHIGSRRNAAYLREAILDPDATIARGYEQFRGVMPKTFGTQLSAAQLESLVRHLVAQK